MRRAALAGALAAVAVLAGFATASAQGQVIQAVDDLSTLNNNRWEPSNVTVPVGATVTWRFDGTQLAHNVASASPNWSVDTPASTQDPRPVAYTFPAEGTYVFVCRFHADSMRGQVTVGSPPPPPPPPLSEQPLPNDQQAPRLVDSANDAPPRLTRVRAAPVAGGARVRFRLSERARVTVRFRLAGLPVETARRTFGRGAHAVTVRNPRMRGRYRVEVRARDFAGNRSRVRRRTIRL
jgi:plastocyanin